MSMEILVANLAGKVRTETIDGREFIIAPMTLIVPGVLTGNEGPLYYSPDDIKPAISLWEDKPITLYHPSINGNYVPALYPGILDKVGMGFLRNVAYSDKLTADGYFDVEKTRRVDIRVYNDLIAGKPIELSTGLFSTHLEQPGIHNGVTYKGRAINHKPDHLAVLPDLVGACSVQRGCGVLVNAEGSNTLGGDVEITPSLIHKLKELLGFGKAISPAVVNSGLSAPTGNAVSQISHDELHNQLHTLIHDKYGPKKPSQMGMSGSGMGSTDSMLADHPYIVDVFDKEVVYSHGGKLWKAKYKTDLRANKLSLEDSPPMEVSRTRSYKPVTNVSPDSIVVSNSQPLGQDPLGEFTHGDATMSRREENIQYLTVNCECWKADKNRAILNTMQDSSIEQLRVSTEKAKQNDEVATAARNGFTDQGGNTHNWNEATKQWESKKVTVNTSTVAPTVVPTPIPVTPTTNSQGDQSRLTTEEQEDLQFARNEKNRQKSVLVNQLTCNVTDQQVKQRLVSNLMGKGLQELQDMTLLVPSQPVANQYPGQMPMFLGAGGGPVSTVASVQTMKDDPNDILVPPTIDWAAEAKLSNSGRGN